MKDHILDWLPLYALLALFALLLIAVMILSLVGDADFQQACVDVEGQLVQAGYQTVCVVVR